MLRFSAHSVYNEITLANDERQRKKKKKKNDEQPQSMYLSRNG